MQVCEGVRDQSQGFCGEIGFNQGLEAPEEQGGAGLLFTSGAVLHWPSALAPGSGAASLAAGGGYPVAFCPAAALALGRQAYGQGAQAVLCCMLALRGPAMLKALPE